MKISWSDLVLLTEASVKGRVKVLCQVNVHIRRYFVDTLTEDYHLAMWFIDEISKMFTVEYDCCRAGKTGTARLLERLKPGNTAYIMSRIESKLLELQDTGQTECGEKLLKAVKYALNEWPAMKRVL